MLHLVWQETNVWDHKFIRKVSPEVTKNWSWRLKSLCNDKGVPWWPLRAMLQFSDLEATVCVTVCFLLCTTDIVLCGYSWSASMSLAGMRPPKRTELGEKRDSNLWLSPVIGCKFSKIKLQSWILAGLKIMLQLLQAANVLGLRQLILTTSDFFKLSLPHKFV